MDFHPLKYIMYHPNLSYVELKIKTVLFSQIMYLLSEEYLPALLRAFPAILGKGPWPKL